MSIQYTYTYLYTHTNQAKSGSEGELQMRIRTCWESVVNGTAKMPTKNCGRETRVRWPFQLWNHSCPGKKRSPCAIARTAFFSGQLFFHLWTTVCAHTFKLDTSHVSTEEIQETKMNPVRKSQVHKRHVPSIHLASFHHMHYKRIIGQQRMNVPCLFGSAMFFYWIPVETVDFGTETNNWNVHANLSCFKCQDMNPWSNKP